MAALGERGEPEDLETDSYYDESDAVESSLQLGRQENALSSVSAVLPRTERRAPPSLALGAKRQMLCQRPACFFSLSRRSGIAACSERGSTP